MENYKQINLIQYSIQYSNRVDDEPWTPEYQKPPLKEDDSAENPIIDKIIPLNSNGEEEPDEDEDDNSDNEVMEEDGDFQEKDNDYRENDREGYNFNQFTINDLF